ncbi:MAG: AMP-binding protein, partial [Rhodospirillales bacterium]|nr:AMP-binding protein [Rhodospirillales bacterium]
MPDAPAVLTAEVTLSHGQLDRAVSWTANSFKDAGLAPGDRVGVHSRTQVQHLITFLALARLGVGQIAFHPSDPPRYQRRLAERLGFRGMVSDGSGRMAEHYSLIQPPPAEIGDYQEFEPTESAPASDGELPFLFVVTSGTTGIPKLGVLSHAGFRPRLRPLA